MPAYNKFNAFVADLANKVHNLGSDTITVALCASAHAPVATNAVLTDLTEIAYTNLSARTVTTTSCTQTAGLLKLILVDLLLSASGAVAAFRYIVLYNGTAASHNLIAWYDYGADVTLPGTGTSFLLDFDNTNGVLQIQ